MKKYGLIGYPLSHSFSKKYFTEKFILESIKDVVYDIYPLENINELPGLLKSEPALYGLNVTIPYKEQVISYLDEMSPVVEKIGACNCIKIEDGKLIGHNTDVLGFERSLLKKLKPSHNAALVLGTGGASKAVQFVLSKHGISFLQVSRAKSANTISYEELDQEIISTHPLIINTTPLGMYPNTESAPLIPYEWIGESHYLFDLVYNPVKTMFLKNGEQQGAEIENGSDMLVDQAEGSWAIWNS
jgi:shikimate dehydrogenase